MQADAAKPPGPGACSLSTSGCPVLSFGTCRMAVSMDAGGIKRVKGGHLAPLGVLPQHPAMGTLAGSRKCLSREGDWLSSGSTHLLWAFGEQTGSISVSLPLNITS